MLRQRILPLRAVGLVAVAAAGGALALGGAALLGKLGNRTVTTIQPVPPLGGGGVGDVSLGTPSRGLSTEEIYKRDAPGVVKISATSVTTVSDPFFGDIFPPQKETEQALGSGFVIDKAGHIVTNYHVVAGAQKVQVSFSGNDLIDAKVIGKDPSTDVAVLQIDAHSRSLTPLPLGDSDRVRVGDPVVAIGNPFGVYTRTITAGIVSALQRSIDSPNGVAIDHAIQTDASINHGNSGGPLINARGQVIGVTSQISTGNTGEQGNIGIGFAIPINTVKTVAAQIIRSGKVEHALLGVKAQPVTASVARLFNLPTNHGLLIDDVTTGSAADKAGLHAGKTNVIVEGESYSIGGDIIVSADGQRVSSVAGLRDIIARKKPGDHLSLEIYRGRSKETVDVTLGRQPPSPNG